jgi:MFS transporter, DHA1 family, multidrug resistance protein
MALLPSAASDTPRSSITFVPSRPASAYLPPESGHAKGLRSPVEEEAERIEHEIEEYGGDDPHQPPLKSAQSFSSKASAVPERDLNMVTWDGPDDPENPQSWSNRYKWCLTAVSIIMTVNVYASLFLTL